MPIARIQLPDGRIARFEVPDGTTPEQVQAAAQTHFDAMQKQSGAQETYDPTGSFGENLAAGLGKSFVDTGRGVKQLGALAGNTLGLVSDETVDKTMQEKDAATKRDEALMNTGGGLTGNIAGSVAQFYTGGGAVGSIPKVASGVNRLRALAAAANAGKAAKAAGFLPAAAGGALYALTQPIGEDESKAGQMGKGAAFSVAGQGVANALTPIARAGVNAVSDSVRQLAQKAEALGIPLRADQIVNSKPLNYLASVIESIPFSGTGASREAQQKAFNTAAAKTIGQNSDNLAEAMASAERDLGGEFDRVLSQTAVKADQLLQDDLARISGDAVNELTEQQLGVFNKQVNNLLSKVGQGDVIDAQAAYNVKKGLDRLAKGNDSSMAHYAKELRGALMEALDRSLGPDEAAKFATTRQQYANMLQLEKLLPNGAEADLSAARLANTRNIRGKDLKELADIASTFLKGRVPSSGTTERAVTAGALAGMAGPQALVAVPTARAARALLESNALRRYLMEGSPTLEKAAPYANKLFPMVGGVYGAQASQ